MHVNFLTTNKPYIFLGNLLDYLLFNNNLKIHKIEKLIIVT